MTQTLTVRMTCPNCKVHESKECSHELTIDQIGKLIGGSWEMVADDISIALVDGIMQLAKTENEQLLVVQIGETFDIWVPNPLLEVLPILRVLDSLIGN